MAEVPPNIILNNLYKAILSFEKNSLLFFKIMRFINGKF
tara:strand:- start:541 stop:657 length:117 start_codon:yes stop_codon:yes gene_type:complete